MGTVLFHYADSGAHGHIEEEDLEKHFDKKMWGTQLASLNPVPIYIFFVSARTNKRHHHHH
jgi:hypothetical protein